jgi:hypothetical protein
MGRACSTNEEEEEERIYVTNGKARSKEISDKPKAHESGYYY